MIYKTIQEYNNITESNSTLVHHHYYISIVEQNRVKEHKLKKQVFNWIYPTNILNNYKNFSFLFIPLSYEKQNIIKSHRTLPANYNYNALSFDFHYSYTPFRLNISEYIRDYHNNFNVFLGVLEHSEYLFTLFFKNETSFNLSIVNILIPGNLGIEVVSYTPTVQPQEEGKITLKAKKDKGMAGAFDFINIQFNNGYSLKYYISINRLNKLFLKEVPLKNSYSESLTFYSRTMETINGDYINENLCEEPRYSSITGKFIIDSSEKELKFISMLRNNFKNSFYQILWGSALPLPSKNKFTTHYLQDLLVKIQLADNWWEPDIIEYKDLGFKKAQLFYLYDATYDRGLLIDKHSIIQDEISTLFPCHFETNILEDNYIYFPYNIESDSRLYLLPVIEVFLKNSPNSTMDIYSYNIINIETEENNKYGIKTIDLFFPG